MRHVRSIVSLGLVACVAFSSGCVRRIVSITSDPNGATVWLNDREIGRTPVDAEFTYYGTYDVRLHKEGFEPLDTSAETEVPWWDNIGPDLIAEAVPARLKSINTWHFTLVPTSTDTAALVERAKQLRESTTPMPMPTTTPAVE